MPESAQEYKEQYQEWVKEYGIDFTKSVEHDTMTQEQYDMLSKLNEDGLVWTEHGTCEDTFITEGFKIFGSCSLLDQKASGCGCWQSYAYYIGNKVCSTDWIQITASLPCSICNPDGEDEEDSFDPDCEECEGEGYAHHWFDE